MVKVVGIRFRNAGKIYYFEPESYRSKSRHACNRGDCKRRRDAELCMTDPREVSEDERCPAIKTGHPHCD